VVQALAVLGPGALDPEPVTSAPTLRWRDAAGEDGYRITVTSALGTTVWQHVEPAHASDPSIPYTGPLMPGMVYHFRVVALSGGVAIGATEEVSGTFFTLP